MRFAEIRAQFKKALNGSAQECIGLIQTYAFQLQTHPSFTINFAHKVWVRAFEDEQWVEVARIMGELGLRTSNSFMWLNKSIDHNKHDLACITHQYANYTTEQNKNLAVLCLALYTQSPFLLAALTHNATNLSYMFKNIPGYKKNGQYISRQRFENKTLAHCLMEEAPISLAQKIVQHNDHTLSVEEWGALVSSGRRKQPVLSCEDLESLLLLDKAHGEYAVQCLIKANSNRWLKNVSEDQALHELPVSNPHFKHIKDVVDHLRAQKIKTAIVENLDLALDTASSVKRKI